MPEEKLEQSNDKGICNLPPLFSSSSFYGHLVTVFCNEVSFGSVLSLSRKLSLPSRLEKMPAVYISANQVLKFVWVIGCVPY